MEQQAQNLEAQADNLIAAAQSADADATSLEQQATDRLAQADTDEAQEYRQLAEGITPAEARQTVYLYNETGQLIGEYDESGDSIREYIYRDTVPLALAANDQIYYYHNDHLATPKLLTDANQNVVWQAKHTPFGKAEIQVEEVPNNLRFPGQYFDEETGLHYNYFRDYDSETGRYLQSDPLGLYDGVNTYAYVGGNPLNYIDSLGLYRQFDDPTPRHMPNVGIEMKMANDTLKNQTGTDMENFPDAMEHSACVAICLGVGVGVGEVASNSFQHAVKRYSARLAKAIPYLGSGYTVVNFPASLEDCRKQCRKCLGFKSEVHHLMK